MTKSADPDVAEVAESELTVRRVLGAIRGETRPAAQTTPTAPPELVPGQLARLRENANLHGFAITANRPVVGMRLLKRALRRLQYQVFARQSDFNDAAVRLLEQLSAESRQGGAYVRSSSGALDAAQLRLTRLETRLAEVVEENARLIESVEQQRVVLAQVAQPAAAPMDYVGMQARFRGDMAEIADRQRRYIGYFREGGTVVDIGSGRGEFLELLGNQGRRGIGVDTDLEMVELCRARDLEVEHDDGLHYLATHADESLDGVFAAQVIEHLQPVKIAGLMETAYRKLRSGGVLILETVNPTSLVALMNFYLDFTHVAPIHPMALEWLAESTGFVDTETLFLSPVQGGPRLRPFPGSSRDDDAVREFDDAVAATNEVLYGPRDYALVARRL